MVLTSATSATSACFNSLTNSAMDRVEWPIVKTGGFTMQLAGPPAAHASSGFCRTACRLSRYRARLIALELPDHGGAGHQLKLRLKPNNSGRQVFNLYLLRLQRISLARHLVLEFDHRGQGAPDVLDDTRQAAF